MGDDRLAPEAHLNQLKLELYKYTNDLNFKKAKSMGHLMQAAFLYITRNFKNVNPFKS
jgi:hypothetical protein